MQLQFNAVKASICQKSLHRIFMMVLEYHNFGMKGNHARILQHINKQFL